MTDPKALLGDMKQRFFSRFVSLRLFLSRNPGIFTKGEELKTGYKRVIQMYKDVLFSYDLINIFNLMDKIHTETFRTTSADYIANIAKTKNPTDFATEVATEIKGYVVFLLSIFVSLGLILPTNI